MMLTNMIETHEHAADFKEIVVLSNFTDYSEPFAVRTCSVQAVRSLSE